MSKAKASNGPYTARRLSFEMWIKPGNFLVHPCVMYKEYKLFIFINWYLSEASIVVELQFVNKHLTYA